MTTTQSFQSLSAKNNVLQYIDRIDLSKLYQSVKKIDFEPGDNIFDAHQSSIYYYLIDTGSIKITNLQGKSTILKTTDSFGDEGLMGLDSQFSTAVAETKCSLFRINSEHIRKLSSFANNSHLANKNFLHNTSKETAEKLSTEYSKGDTALSIFYWILAIVIPLLSIYWMQTLDVPPNRNQSSVIFIFLSAITIWVLHLAPPIVPSIYLLSGMVLLSLAPMDVVLSGFYSNTFFLMISLSILSATMQTSGLSYRMLLYLYKFNTKNKAWRQFVIFFSGAIMTPVFPSANGRSLIVHSLFNETLEAFKIKKTSKEYQRLVASAIGGISLLSPMFLTSKSINLLAFGMLPAQIQHDFQFFNWMVSASIVGIILLLFYTLFTWILFRNNDTSSLDNEQLKGQLVILGKFTMRELFAIVAVLLFVLIVFTKSIHNLNTSWLAMLLTLILLVVGSFKYKNFNKLIEWDFLVVLSALLGFSSVVVYLKLDAWVSYYLGGLTQIIQYDFVIFVAYLSMVIFVLRLVMPINVVVILMCSILIPVTTSAAFNPWVVVFIVLLMSENYTYNASCSYILNFFNLIGDENTQYWRLMLLQILMYIVKFVAVIISIPFWRYLGIL